MSKPQNFDTPFGFGELLTLKMLSSLRTARLKAQTNRQMPACSNRRNGSTDSTGYDRRPRRPAYPATLCIMGAARAGLLATAENPVVALPETVRHSLPPLTPTRTYIEAPTFCIECHRKLGPCPLLTAPEGCQHLARGAKAAHLERLWALRLGLTEAFARGHRPGQSRAPRDAT